MVIVLKRPHSWTSQSSQCIRSNADFKYFLNVLNPGLVVWGGKPHFHSYLNELSKLSQLPPSSVQWFVSLRSLFCTPSAPELVPGRQMLCPPSAASTAGINFLHLIELFKLFPAALTLQYASKYGQVVERALAEVRVSYPSCIPPLYDSKYE